MLTPPQFREATQVERAVPTLRLGGQTLWISPWLPPCPAKPLSVPISKVGITPFLTSQVWKSERQSASSAPGTQEVLRKQEFKRMRLA